MQGLLIEGLRRDVSDAPRGQAPCAAQPASLRPLPPDRARGWTAVAALAALIGLGLVAHWMAEPPVDHARVVAPSAGPLPAEAHVR